MWLVVGRNDRNIEEASGVAFDEGKFGSFVLDQMWAFFKAMSSWQEISACIFLKPSL